MRGPTLLLALLLACRGGAAPPTVVFVCEHGSAKSVVAAALFEARARDHHLRFRAVARGVTPDTSIAPQALAGLRTDRLTPVSPGPIALSRGDVDTAARVIAFGPLPPALAEGGHVEHWDGIPAVSVSYSAARDAMLRRIDALLAELDGE